jgi:hypothetical protein
MQVSKLSIVNGDWFIVFGNRRTNSGKKTAAFLQGLFWATFIANVSFWCLFVGDKKRGLRPVSIC